MEFHLSKDQWLTASKFQWDAIVFLVWYGYVSSKKKTVSFPSSNMRCFPATCPLHQSNDKKDWKTRCDAEWFGSKGAQNWCLPQNFWLIMGFSENSVSHIPYSDAWSAFSFFSGHLGGCTHSAEWWLMMVNGNHPQIQKWITVWFNQKSCLSVWVLGASC